jgi:mannose-6-phosphate isomerase-like protein (cupin superfamily)
MSHSPTRTAHISFADALAQGPPPPGNLAVPIFSRGSIDVELYTPVDRDHQKPHGRDEIYFVARGNGQFFDGARRHAVEAGSFLFVAAGQPHRFEEFSSDFAVWVVFYGPEGGESDE